MDRGLEDREKKEPDEDSSGEGLASVAHAMEPRLGEGQGEGKADWRDSERNERVEGDENVVSTALVNHAGDELDMAAPRHDGELACYRRGVMCGQRPRQGTSVKSLEE